MATKQRKFAKAKEHFENTSVLDIGQSTASNASIPASFDTDNHESMPVVTIDSSLEGNRKENKRKNSETGSDINSEYIAINRGINR
jgi:hypothetical protein